MNTRSSLVVALAFLFSSVSGIFGSAAGASSAKTDVFIESYYNGSPIPGACVVLKGYSNEGCDENSDGAVRFAAIPDGRYTVHYTKVPAGFALPGDVAITVRANGSGEMAFEVDLEATTDHRDIGVAFHSADDGSLVRGVCAQLHGYSKVGCDKNRDGMVTFDDIPYGTYQVDVISAPNGLALDGDVYIDVDALHPYDSGNGVADVYLWSNGQGGSSATTTSGNGTTIGVVAVDAVSGDIVYGTCFQLRGYSKVGCDKNNDGAVTFQDIPYGTYTVDTTSVPNPYDVTSARITVDQDSAFDDGYVFIVWLNRR